MVIDDSIVRGNTSKHLVEMLREAGAAEVHLRIVSPEVMWPCCYGVSIEEREHLLAVAKDVNQMREFIGCDSLAFLSIEGLRHAVQAHHSTFCEACFTGEYPVEIPASLMKA